MERMVRMCINKNFRIFAAGLVLLLIPAGCADKNTKLEGDRRVVFSTPRLQADPTAGLTPLRLSEPLAKTSWVSYGGDGDQAPQHLAWGGNWNQAWETDIGTGASANRSLLTVQPVSANGVVFTLDGAAQLQATQLADGARIWRRDLAEDASAAVAQGGLVLANDWVIAALGNGVIRASAQKDGKPVWSQTLPAPIRRSPQADDSHLYVVTVDNALYALNLEDGSIAWEMRGVGEKARLLRQGSLSLTRDLLVAPMSTGSLVATQPLTGRRLWEVPLADDQPTDLVAALPGIVATAAIADGIVYVAGFSNHLVAIQSRTGAILWQVAMGTATTPWVSGDMLYVVSPDGQLVCLFRKDGKIRWVKPLPAAKEEKDVTVWYTPTLVDGKLLLANQHGRVLAISPYTGEVESEHQIDGGISSAPIVVGSTLLWLTQNGQLQAYR